MQALRRILAATLFLASGVAAHAQAITVAPAYSNLFIFGDSLSDTGNLSIQTFGVLPGSPYAPGRYSNGPLWVETLASGLGLANGAVANRAGGNNYAVAGARSGVSTAVPQGVLTQVNTFYLPTHAVADPNALFVLLAGGNDLRDARSANPNDTLADANARQAAAAATANNIAAAMTALAQSGARNVMVVNLPDLGATPEAVSGGTVFASTDITQRFDALLPSVVGSVAASYGVKLSFLDFAALSASVRNDALSNGGAVYGITNVTTPCGSFAGSVGISCAVSLFSDNLHPSAAAHALLGQAALALLSPVPEPAVWLTMAAGLLLLAARQRRAVHG